ncbi:hypothetical protein ACQP2E_19890 [Actinoplanes sp. CA-015351]|uniref:hypothetical protein n=1 Tax=Actinoplanes sp. CA-015351 TaxID=3239897 RepID=UPI003D952402
MGSATPPDGAAALTEARRSVDALRPETLATVRLTGALSEAAERWSALHGLPVTVTTTGTPRPVTPDAEFALLRTPRRPSPASPGTPMPPERA